MALTQIGYLGNTGPIFTDDSPGGGKKIMLVGRVYGGVMKLVAVQPAYVANLNAGYNPSDFVLGSYTDLQVVGDAPAYTQPSTGAAYVGYTVKGTDWVTATSTTGNETATGSGNTTGGSTSTGGGSTSTGGGVTTTGGDTTFSAPTIMEQVTTFFSNYWWLVGIILLFLFWKQISGALGFGKKRRR